MMYNYTYDNNYIIIYFYFPFFYENMYENYSVKIMMDREFFICFIMCQIALVKYYTL